MNHITAASRNPKSDSDQTGNALDQARTMLAIAAVNAVHFPALVSFQVQFDPDLPIDWQVLLIGRPQNSSEGEAGVAEPSLQPGESAIKEKVPVAEISSHAES